MNTADYTASYPLPKQRRASRNPWNQRLVEAIVSYLDTKPTHIIYRWMIGIGVGSWVLLLTLLKVL